jgi:ComF family protein
MWFPAKKYLDSCLHIFFPHLCEGCGADSIHPNNFLCVKCMHRLPTTGYFDIADNPVEKIFYGRLPIEKAAAAFYFTKASLVQHLISELKYKNNKAAGFFLGRMMGQYLANTTRFETVDLLIPLPLHPLKEHLRGYNQAQIICAGIQSCWKKPIENNALKRAYFRETQTQQNRVSRWQNMEGIFEMAAPELVKNRHVLLVDDVITTGATLEAAGTALLSANGTRLSIAAAAFTLRH